MTRGRRLLAVVLGAGALGLAGWTALAGRRAAQQEIVRAADEARQTAARLVAKTLQTIAAEAAAAASVPQLQAAIRSGVDTLTLEDLFTNEDWWMPYRDRALTVVGPQGTLIRRPASHALPVGEWATRARTGKAVATVLSGGDTVWLVGAAVVNGTADAPLLTLARPADAALLRQWLDNDGTGLAITDSRAVRLSAHTTVSSELLVATTGEPVLSADGHAVASAAPLAEGLRLWVIRPVAPGGPVSLFGWVGCAALALAAGGLAWGPRPQRAGLGRSNGSGSAVVIAPHASGPSTKVERVGGDAKLAMATGPRPSPGANAPTLIATGGGQSFGRYSLLTRIGEGGMSDIFAATLSGAEGFQRLLVIKRLKPELARNRAAVDQFIDEAKLGSILNHSNIVQVLDFGKVEDGYYMALEYIAGRNVGQVIDRHRERVGRPLDVPTVFFMAHEALQALSYSHDRTMEDGEPLRIVHRDVSPGNLLVSSTGAIKLIDFGIVKAEERVSRTELGNVKGNPAFMSPEQARGQAVDARSDLFSLGLVMYQALTNVAMYEGGSSAETLYKAASGPVSRDLERIAALPPVAARVLRRALATDPSDRYATADEFAAELVGEIKPTAKSDLATLMHALFGPELRPQSGGTAGSSWSSGIGRKRTG